LQAPVHRRWAWGLRETETDKRRRTASYEAFGRTTSTSSRSRPMLDRSSTARTARPLLTLFVRRLRAETSTLLSACPLIQATEWACTSRSPDRQLLLRLRAHRLTRERATLGITSLVLNFRTSGRCLSQCKSASCTWRAIIRLKCLRLEKRRRSERAVARFRVHRPEHLPPIATLTEIEKRRR